MTFEEAVKRIDERTLAALGQRAYAGTSTEGRTTPDAFSRALFADLVDLEEVNVISGYIYVLAVTLHESHHERGRPCAELVAEIAAALAQTFTLGKLHGGEPAP